MALLRSFIAQVDDLLELAVALPDIHSLISLTTTCRSLFPLSHHGRVWACAFKRDFPDLAASEVASEGLTRQLYVSVTTPRTHKSKQELDQPEPL